MYKVRFQQKHKEEFSYPDEMFFVFETMEATSFFCETAMRHGVDPVKITIEYEEAGEAEEANEEKEVR